jgi:hypothetical protein
MMLVTTLHREDGLHTGFEEIHYAKFLIVYTFDMGEVKRVRDRELAMIVLDTQSTEVRKSCCQVFETRFKGRRTYLKRILAQYMHGKI